MNIIKFFNKAVAKISTNYWAIPACFVFGAIVLNLIAYYLDIYLNDTLKDISFLAIKDAESARTILSTIATTMMTVAGVSFSMTLLAVVHASSQIGPRILSGFLDDTGNQVTLGVLVACFTFGLLTLISVQAPSSSFYDNPEIAIPKLRILLSLAGALAGVFSFIYFIHHVPLMIRTTYAVNRVGNKTIEETQEFFTKHISDKHPVAVSLEKKDYIHCHELKPKRNGYLQLINFESLIKTSEKHQFQLRFKFSLGEFLTTEDVFVEIFSPQKLSEETLGEIENDIIYGGERSMQQDFQFGFYLLLEIGARALSPGINDPFTFNECVDQLYAGLITLEKHHRKKLVVYNSDNNMVMRLPDFSKDEFIADLLESLFYYAKDDPQARPYLQKKMQRFTNENIKIAQV
ncbi:MAG: hypothetical protein CME62_06635 [Halobacteriovoraceae bacterium]|nr:hypothetical protein [Halobacteriovoraceae bacterium]|tara:strand:- start:30296 stop:31507 length:1212 start_codon:yes stop_codon:yes gene_type:complete